MNESILPILPLSSGMLLPGQRVPLVIDSDAAATALRSAMEADRTLLVVPQRTGRYASVGCVARVVQTGQTPTGSTVIVVDALHRAAVGTGVPAAGEALWVTYEARPDPAEATEEQSAMAETLRGTLERLAEVRRVPQLLEMIRKTQAPGALADLLGYAPELSWSQRLELLETLNVGERLQKANQWSSELLTELTVKQEIRTEVAEDMNKAQREFVLRKQLEAIRKELGEGADSDDEEAGEGYRERIEAADMPDEVRQQALKELKRLDRANEQSAEYGYLRNYLDWICDVPWGRRSDGALDLSSAREVLDTDHAGLEDVKTRIGEFLAVRKLRETRGAGSGAGRGHGAILTLVGPPGVGKTSLGESVARALGRKFARIALGGVRDEAEIRGHRRTYVGSMPGRIVRGLKEAGSMNPVFLLDEVDKLGSDWRGDPSAALLEVLDPAQNHRFNDHYLEVPVDLSDVVFICTANLLETIPGALRDRMEVIPLEGYTELEKREIAERHLLPRQLSQHGLEPGEVALSNEALQTVIRSYTREAGVRNLERELGKVVRKATTAIAAEQEEPPVVVDAERLEAMLGAPRYVHEAALRTSSPGVATGLSVTGAGGDVLFVEASQVGNQPDAGGATLILTGQLGDVMKESARIALSYVTANAERLGIVGSKLTQGRFHLHVPAGAIPKDGPSAGITLVAALVSVLSGRPIKSSVAMTGEATLLGQVLPVGGIKQKLLAAHRAGLKEVIVPQRNASDLEKVPESVRREMTFHLVSRVDEVLQLALKPAQASADQASSQQAPPPQRANA